MMRGIGVTGDEGRGACWRRRWPELLVVTFGKGFGVSGAAVLSARKASQITLCCNLLVIWFTAPVCRPPGAGVKRTRWR